MWWVAYAASTTALDNGVGLIPAAGWSSWNVFAGRVSADAVSHVQNQFSCKPRYSSPPPMQRPNPPFYIAAQRMTITGTHPGTGFHGALPPATLDRSGSASRVGLGLFSKQNKTKQCSGASGASD